MAINRRNTGYTTRDDGSAISVRGLSAEENGKFSEGKFRSYYHVAKKDFDVLLSLGLIKSEEWHHTGARFNRRDFYEWKDSDEIDYSEMMADGRFPEGSLAEKYFTQRKAIAALVKEAEQKPWEYVEEKFGFYNIPSFEEFLKNGADSSRSSYGTYTLNSNLISVAGKGIEDYLNAQDREEREREHSAISRQGDILGSASYRRDLHQEVDTKYNQIAIDRIPKEVLQQAYDNAVADDIKHNAEVEGKREQAQKENMASDGKEKVLIRIGELMGMESSEAAEVVYDASMRHLAHVENAWAEEKRQEYGRQIEAVVADIESKQKAYIERLIKQGRAERRERIDTLPQMFVTEKEEMNGRYGWFTASSYYKLPRYYTGTEFKDRRGFNHYNDIRKNNSNLIEVLNDKRDFEIAAGPSEKDLKRLRMQRKEIVNTPAPSAKEALIRDELIRRMRESGIDVVTDERRAQRVLERANSSVRFSGGGQTQKSVREVLYTSYNVDDVEGLKEKYPSALPDKYYHHSTVKFGSQPIDAREGKKERLHIIGRLTTDIVDVLVVDNPESANRTPHITLATAEGVKPVASNFELEKHKDKIQPLDDYVDVTFRNNLRGGIAATPVTTPDFKEWFGDWENNPEQASKVVSAQGKPLVVYHGTGSYGFNTFDNKETWNYDLDRVEKTGIYFTSDKKNAIGYEDKEIAQLLNRNHIENGTYSVYLNMRNPLIVDYQGAWWNGRKFNYEVIDKNDNVIKILNTRQDADKLVEDFSKQHGYKPKINNVELYSGLKRVSQYVSEAIEKGYDGVICKNVRDSHIDNHYAEPATDYVVLNPNQIKSATENIGTYRRDSNDIRFHLAEEQPIFISNAMLALDKIKQEKATPEQWLKMLEKNGGIKAGEDRWTGLSEWLKESESASLTKTEIQEYLNENQIEVEEVHYQSESSYYDSQAFKELNKEFNDIRVNIAEVRQERWNEADEIYASFMSEMQEKYGEEWSSMMNNDEIRKEGILLERRDEYGEDVDYDIDEAAFEEMVERYGDDFSIAFSEWDSSLQISDTDYAASFLELEKEINRTREQYTTAGLENNREIALVVPTIESWNDYDEIHFGDAGEGRAVAWVRFGETRKPYNEKHYEKVLVIDEIQSKRHQEGREKGYRRGIRAERDAVAKIWSDSGRTDDNAYKRLQALNQELRNWEEHEQWKDNNAWRIPDAPFDKNWQELCMKRMLRYAAENGYDRVAWTTGEQQAERYDLSNKINFISYDRGNRTLLAGTLVDGSIDYNQYNIEETHVAPEDLHKFIGKELAPKVLEKGILQGEDLRVGGEGMKAFYDNILVKFTEKYTKKWGAKTEDVELPEIGETMHSVPVTEQMRSDVMQGQPMFFKTQTGEAYGFAYDNKIYVDTKIATAETPIHEYAHLWAEVLRENNPREWKNIVSLMKGATDVWQKVERQYPELHSDDEIADEVLAQYSGKRGYERLMQEHSSGEVSKDAFDRLTEALEKLWKKVAEFFRIHYTTKEEVADRILKDLLSGVNPRQEVEKFLKKQDKEYMRAVEQGDEKKVQKLFQSALMFSVGNGMTPYIAAGGYRGKMAPLARKVKTMDKTAINKAAERMAPLIPKNAVLVPAPSHKGEATDMLMLAKAIARQRNYDVKVMDVLKSYERERQYISKKVGGKAIDANDMGIVAIKDIPEGKIPVIIDNVVSTGNTAEACVKALGYGVVVSLADATTAYKHTASLKSAAPVMRNQAGQVIPLSKRFDLSGARYIAHAAALQKVDSELSLEFSDTREKSNSPVQGLEGYTQDEIKDIVESYVQDILDESDIDATIEKVTIIGSRSRNEAKADSDLDILLEYSGEDYPEDAMYNLLHDDENPLEIEGLKVDINPINPHYSLSTEEWLARDARWREEDKKKNSINNKKANLMKESIDKPYIIHIGTDDRGIVEGEFHVQFTDDNIKLNFDDISKYLKENGGAMRLMDGKPWFDFYDKASAERFAEQITSIGKNITNTINSNEMEEKNNQKALIEARTAEVREIIKEAGLVSSPLVSKTPVNYDNKVFRYSMVSKNDVVLYENLTDSYDDKNGVSISDLPEEKQLEALLSIKEKYGTPSSTVSVLLDIQQVPDYALAAIVNDDFSGIDSAEDEKNIRDFINREYYKGAIFSPREEEASFTSRPAFGPAADCVTTDIIRTTTIQQLREETKKLNENLPFPEEEKEISKTDKRENSTNLNKDKNMEQNTAELSSEEKQEYIHNILGVNSSNKEFNFRESVMYEQDGVQKYYVDGVSVNDEGSVIIMASNMDNAGFSNTYTLDIDDRQEFDTALDVAYKAIKEEVVERVSKLEDRAVKLFGKDFEFDYSNEDKPGSKVDLPDLGNMPDSISINKIFIKDGKLSLISDDMGGNIEMSGMSFNDIEKMYASFDDIASYTRQQQKLENQTSALKQFYDFKARRPDTILLFRTGDFYEVYGEDVPKAAEILGITATKHIELKEKDGQPLRQAMFPHHALDTYLPKLIRAGHRVAICEPSVKVEKKKGITATAAAQEKKPAQVSEERKDGELRSTALFKDKKGVWNLAIVTTKDDEFMRQIIHPKEEDVKAFLKEAKGKTKAEVEQLRNALAEKYLAALDEGKAKAVESSAVKEESAEAKYIKSYADLMIAKIEEMQAAKENGNGKEWKKPWFGVTALPRSINGTSYLGMNNLMLQLYSEKQGYTVPVFATFRRFEEMNYTEDKSGKRQPAKDKEGNILPRVHVLKGQSSFPVKFNNVTFVNDKTGEKLSYKKFRELSEEERKEYSVKRTSGWHHVFCVEQTNLKEARPDLYAKLAEPYKMKNVTKEGQVMDFTPVDMMISDDLWICPINIQEGGDRAFFSPGQNAITFPAKTQFYEDEEYYSNLFHEMAHSTGVAPLHNRLKPTALFGTPDYADEELVAELTAAVVASQQGMTKEIKEESALYLASWLDAIKEHPSYLANVLHDVDKASATINTRIADVEEQISLGLGADYSKIHEYNDELRSKVSGNVSIEAAAENPTENVSIEETQVQDEVIAEENQEERTGGMKL